MTQPATGTNAKTLRLSAAAVFSTSLLTVPLSLVAVPFVLHGLDLGAYGAYATVASILSIVGLAEAGVTTQVVRRVAAARGEGNLRAAFDAINEANSALAVTAIVVTTVSLLSVPVTTHLVFRGLPSSQQHQVRWILIAVSLQAGVSLVLTPFLSIPAALQRSDVAAYAGPLIQILGVAVTLGGLRAGLGLWSLYLSTLATAASSFAVSLIAVRHLWPDLRFRFARYSWARHYLLLAAGTPIVLANVSNIVDFQLDKITVSHFDNTAAAGAYQLGTAIALSARTLSLAPIGLVLAGAAELMRTQPQKLRRLEEGAHDVTVCLACLVMAGVVAYGGPFVKLWLNNPGQGIASATIVLGGALYMNCLSAPWFFYCVARDFRRTLTLASATNVIVNASLSIPLTAAYGLDGALAGSLVGNFAGLIAFWALLSRVGVPLSDILGRLVKPALVTGLVGLAAAWLAEGINSWPKMLVEVTLFSFLLSALLYFTGCLPRRELQALFRRSTDSPIRL